MQLCRACTSLRRAEIDAALIAGASDVEVARRFGLKRAAIQRHRVRHLIQPMRDRIALLTRDSEEQRQRQQLAQAVAEGELSTEALVAAHLGLRAQTKKLSRIEDRLEREAAHAEDIHHLTGGAAIAGAQLRAIETGAKMAGTGGFKTSAVAAGGGVLEQKWSIQMIFPGANRVESINIVAASGAPAESEDGGAVGDTIEGTAEE